MTSNNLKGLIAEEFCRFHLSKSGFNIINSGKEWFDKDLADTLIDRKAKKSNIPLLIFNNIISKLPDFMIWRETEEKIEYKYVEVKYRAKLDPQYFKNKLTKHNIPYIRYECSEKNDPLEIYKYIENLQNLKQIINETKHQINDAEFYIYLVTNSNLEDRPDILFGKVFGDGNSGYSVYFYTPSIVEKSFNQTWPNYKSIANYLIENKIETIYSKEFLLENESMDTIKKFIKTTILQ